jgi:hypothetical protein
MKRDEMHAKGVIARKNEKARIKQIKKMKKQGVFIPTELMTPIADPEAEWKSSKEVWNAEQEKKKIKRRDDENDHVQFIVETVGDSKLSLRVNDQMDGQADHMAFDLDDEDNFDQDEDDYFD